MFRGSRGTPDRFTKLRDNFFSLGANNRNASESPTAALMEFKNKTLFLLEELPVGRIASSLLKSITSKDVMRGRQLHSSMTSVKIIGKLLINANTAPDLGEEGPVWDRAVYIPWDTRYVTGQEQVDTANYRLPSDNAKKSRLLTLTSAFMTVCLKELHNFLKRHINEDGELTVSELPQPQCVLDLVAKEKERAFPLKKFIKEYLKEDAEERVCVHDFFNAYRGFLRTRNLRSSESLDDVLAKFCRVGLTYCMSEGKHGDLEIPGFAMSEEGDKLAQREAINRGVNFVDVPGSSIRDGPLGQAFKKQRLS